MTKLTYILLFICSLSYGQIKYDNKIIFTPEWHTNSSYPLDGDAYRFDAASTQYSFYADSGLFDIVNMGGATMSAWFKTTINDANFRCIIGKGATTGYNGRYLILFRSGKILVVAQADVAGAVVTSILTYNDNKWHHIAITIDTSSYLMTYIDAIKCDSVDISTWTWAESSGFPTAYNTHVGSNGGTGTYNSVNSFDGDIRDARLYPRALTQTEVNTVYNGKGVGDEMFWLMPLINGNIDASGNCYDFTNVNPNANFYITGDWNNPLNTYGYTESITNIPFDYSTVSGVLPIYDIEGTVMKKLILKQ